MATAFENFALTDLAAKPEDAARLASVAAAEGQRIPAHGAEYYRCWLGEAAVIVRTRRNYETGEFEMCGMDTHAASDCDWDCEIADDITPDSYDASQRRLLVTAGGESAAVVEVVDADVLTDFDCGKTIRLNMVAFPRWVHYYEDEAHYRAGQAQHTGEEGTVLPRRGVYACGYAQRLEENAIAENLVLVHGAVKDIRVGNTSMGFEPMTTYISATVETDMGDIEMVHTAEMVAAEEKDIARVGAEVSALCVFSGDAAVGELSGGVFYDERTDLLLLRHFFEHGGAERLRSAMHSEVTYLSDRSDTAVEGVENVIALLKDVEDAMSDERCYFVYPGLLTGIDHIEGREDPPYGSGKRCLLLAQGGPEQYVSLCFVETDSLGRIRTIRMSSDGRYNFDKE